MKPNIELYVDELVLYGFPANDRHKIGEAVQIELTRLIREQGLPSSFSQGGEFARMDGGTFNMPQNSKSETVGAQVAQSVYEGFTK